MKWNKANLKTSISVNNVSALAWKLVTLDNVRISGLPTDFKTYSASNLVVPKVLQKSKSNPLTS